MAIKLAEQTNGPHIFMRLRLDSGRVEHPGGAAADHCGVSYAVLTCFLYISRGGCRFSVSSPLLAHKDVI